MKVMQLMARNVRSCKPTDSLHRAAQLMWESDCGSTPIVNDEGEVIGFLTDRDICMAAYTQSKPLADIAVSSAMSREVFSCRPEDNLSAAEKLMEEKQIRRLPVIDTFGKLVGIISLNDIALEAKREQEAGRPSEITESEIGEVLGAICQHRHEVQLGA